LPVFSNRMKELRQENHLTQADMAALLEKSLRHYQAIESGTVNVSATMLIFLSRHFHVSTDYLLGLTDER